MERTMFGSSSIKIDKHLLTRVKRYADLAGYSSVEEFITHVLEKEISRIEESDSEEEIKKKLKGLGYLS
jgi:metal-responsive CopG/Arc/MetJ family transcriptional regulator